jgi:trypsin-like peptidase
MPVPIQRFRRRFLSRLLLLLACSFAYSAAQTAGGAQAAVARFRVVRSLSGSKGHQEGGRFIIEDPRSRFFMPEDKEIIVYFEWEGPPGSHHFEGYWKNPEGKAVVISDFSFESRDRRFGGYWTLTLTDGTAPGLWSLEARVDGEVTGSHSFEVTVAAKPAGAVGGAKQPLPASQIYQRALAATVTVDRLSASGEKVVRGSGFFVADGIVLTAFEVVDGASSVRLQLPSGEKVQVGGLLRWNRWQDWALLKAPGLKGPVLPRAQQGSWAVGDRSLFLNVSGDGSRNIVDTNLTGTNSYPSAGERLLVPYPIGADTAGSPLLNEYGEVIGLMVVHTIPGASSLATGTFFSYSNFLPSKNFSQGLALPINAVPEPPADTAETPMADLLQNGMFIPPLVGYENVAQGELTLRVENRQGFSPLPSQQRSEFSHKDGQFAAFVMWNPKEKLNTQTVLRLYDLHNRLLYEGKPAKLNLRPNQITYSTWQVGIEKVPAGQYRIDIMLGNQPAWRTFFSVSE